MRPRRCGGWPTVISIEAALAVANGQAVPDAVTAAFERLPDVMNRADAKAGQVDSAVLELAEAVVLACRVGEQFTGTVTDIDKQRGARIQLADPAVITRVPVNGLNIGATVQLRLDEADPARAADAILARLGFDPHFSPLGASDRSRSRIACGDRFRRLDAVRLLAREGELRACGCGSRRDRRYGRGCGRCAAVSSA